MTQNRRKRGFNDGTEDRSVAPYFQWKLKYGAIASSPQAPYPLLPREARKQAHSAAAPLQIKAGALIWFFYVQRAQPKSSEAAFRLKTRAPSPSLCSVGRREGRASRTPEGVFPTHMSPEKQYDCICFANSARQLNRRGGYHPPAQYRF